MRFGGVHSSQYFLLIPAEYLVGNAELVDVLCV